MGHSEKQLELAEALYDLDLHECCCIDDGENDFAIRVPGGWIYRSQEEQETGHITVVQTFVPYSDEFNPNPPKRKETTILGKKMSDFL